MTKWILVPYGNAVVNGEPESEWGWMVMREDDTESIEVESRNRGEQIAAMLNAVEADGELDAAGLRKAADLNSYRQTPETYKSRGDVEGTYKCSVCPEFVTQEGREIHANLEHSQFPDFGKHE